MSAVILILTLLAVALGGCIIYGAYRLYLSGEIDDELAERELAQQRAERVKQYENKNPKAKLIEDLKRIKDFTSRPRRPRK